MRISIGFEFQTNHLSVGLETQGPPTDPMTRIYHPDHLCVLNLKTTPQYSLAVYGDAISQKQDKEKATESMRYLFSKYQAVLINDDHKIRLGDDYTYLLNDAEFLVTYPHPRDIQLKMLLTFMEKKTKAGMETIQEFVKSKSSYVPIKSVKGISKTSSRPKTENNFPFHSFLRIPSENINDNGVLLSPFPKPKVDDFSYYAQVTLGIDLEHVWGAMKMLAEQVVQAPKIIPSEKTKARTLFTIESELDARVPESMSSKHKLVRALYLLFVYSFKNKSEDRKSDPFVIRHHFVDMLKLLSPSGIQKMVSWLATPELKTLARQLYDKSPLIRIKKQQRTPEQKDKYLQQKMYQGVEYVTTFPIHPEGLQTMILFEFRYWNAVLNNRISKRKDTHDFITGKELK